MQLTWRLSKEKIGLRVEAMSEDGLRYTDWVTDLQLKYMVMPPLGMLHRRHLRANARSLLEQCRGMEG
jgi:hypothetical protein